MLMNWKNFAVALSFAVALPAFAASLKEAPVIADAAELGVGRLVKLNVAEKNATTVIAFTSSTCPVAKRYAPTLEAIEKQFGPRGVKFVYVDPIATDSVSAPVIKDSKNKIASALGARSTAEVFVIDAGRTLVYRGAIDDQIGRAHV